MLFNIHFSFANRQRSPSAHLVRRKGGTPCWLHYSWLLLAPAQNRFRVVRALRVFRGGRSVVRALTNIFLANVTVQARPTAEVYTFAARESDCIATTCGS